LPGDLAPRDAQDLMAYPFFSLAKSRRVAPIDFRAGTITIRVSWPKHGMATSGTDVLIWAASQIVEPATPVGESRLGGNPYEILTAGRASVVAIASRLNSTDNRPP
jgi:plasmid replication initiation protein